MSVIPEGVLWIGPDGYLLKTLKVYFMNSAGNESYTPKKIIDMVNQHWKADNVPFGACVPKFELEKKVDIADIRVQFKCKFVAIIFCYIIEGIAAVAFILL